MLRKFLLCTVIVLLLSSGVFADIGLTQDFEIIGSNPVKAVGGFGKGYGRNYLEIGQEKMESKACLGSAVMKQGGIFTQEARVRTRSGVAEVSVRQQASVDGSQNSFIGHGRGRRVSHTQGQSLNLNFNTIARKPFNAVGRVKKSSQSFVGGQSQEQSYRGGFSASSQFIHAEQDVKIKGGPNSNVVVNNTLDVKMNQGNSVSGGPAP